MTRRVLLFVENNLYLRNMYKYAVWNELEKENEEFFKAYAQYKSKDDRMSEEETSQIIQKMMSESSKATDD